MKYEHHQDVAWREVDEEGVVVDARTGKIYPLNPVATFIWKQIDGTKDLEEIEALVLENFDVSDKEAADDFDQFLRQLTKDNLIVEKNKK